MKKLLTLLLALCMVLSLAACGGSSSAPASSGTSGAPASSSTSSTASSTTGTQTKSLKVWVPEALVSFTEEQISKFISEHPEYADYKVSVEPVGEGDAASNMLMDVSAGADIFHFAQDQLARLVSANALVSVSDENAEVVKAENVAASVAAATLGDTLYAYPLTADNGYFLYYDKSVVTDPGSLEAILADCEAAGKSFYMEINSGWYQPAFFFGAGCELTYDSDDSGAFTKCNINYASDAGVAALKAMIELHKSPAFHNGSSISNATNVAAIVDGTWDSGAAKELFGDNYACAKLPTVKMGGKDTQLGGFTGFKLLGVKPQTDADKLAFCDALALYLAGGEVQAARYAAVNWGPSNSVAQADPAVQADVALSALRDQIAFDIPQGGYPGDYWSLATALGDSVIAGEYDKSSDAELLAVLQQFQDTCISYAK